MAEAVVPADTIAVNKAGGAKYLPLSDAAVQMRMDTEWKLRCELLIGPWPPECIRCAVSPQLSTATESFRAASELEATQDLQQACYPIRQDSSFVQQEELVLGIKQ